MISQCIALISLVVREYDEALVFYVGKLGFDLYRERGIEFVRAPKAEPYGTVAVFRNLYGNLWDLLEPRSDG